MTELGKMGQKPKCTYCGGTEFYEGPSGGASTNILCANKECRHWFNITPLGIEDLKTVESTVEEKELEKKKREEEETKRNTEIHCEGYGLFHQNAPAKSCLVDSPYGGYGAARTNLLRLCGYIDAMREMMMKKAGIGDIVE